MLATHRPTYTEQEFEYVEWYNERVQYFYYAATFGFVAVLAASNATSRIIHSRLVARRRRLSFEMTRPKEEEEEEARGTTTRSVSRALEATVATYRKWTYRRSRLLDLLGIASAAQGTVILGHSIVLFSLAVSGSLGHWDYIAHHCARLCFAMIPLLVGLASRELSVISWITGFESSTLVALHRWIGRSAIVLAGVHVAGRMYTNVPRIDLTIGYQAWGLVGLVLWVTMSVLSIRPIRTRAYKLFIFGHVGAFCGSLVALSLHRPEVAPYLISGAAVYASDRIVRVGAVVYYYILVRILTGLRRGRGRNEVDEGGTRALPVVAGATIELVSKDVMRVKVETKTRWKPGAHAYLHAPLIDAGGHPFSIASACVPLCHDENENVSSESTTLATQTFIVRIHEGFTRKLRDRAIEEQETSRKMANDDDDSALRGQEEGIDRATTPAALTIRLSPIFTEGPYGHSFGFDRFESVLIVVGGTGVTFAIGFVLDLVRRARRREQRHHDRRRSEQDERGGRQRRPRPTMGRTTTDDEERPLVTKRVTLAWSVRDAAEVEWVGTDLRRAIEFAPLGFLNVEIHVTRGTAAAAATAASTTTTTTKKATTTTTTMDPTIPTRTTTTGNERKKPRVGDELEPRSSSVEPELARPPPPPRPCHDPCDENRRSSTCSSSSDATELTRFEYVPTSPTESMLAPPPPPPPPSSSSLTLVAPVEQHGDSKTSSSSSSSSDDSLVGQRTTIAYHYGQRCHARGLVERKVAATSRAGSVAVATCGPARLTADVADAVSDLIDPVAVWTRGESRLNIMLHVERYGW